MRGKLLVTGITALSLMGLAACGGKDKKDDEADASVVIQDAGVTDTDAATEDGGPAPEDAGSPDAGNDAGEGDEDAGPGPGGCPADKPYKLGGTCYGVGDECDETFPEGCANGNAVYCKIDGTVDVIVCGEGTTCGVATDKLEIDWDGNYAWGVDCMIPCEKSGDVFTMCGSEAYDGYEIEYACSHLRGGGLGAYWREQNECFHGCDEEEGACILLAPDEGKWCTPTAMTDVEAYPQHCTDDGYVVFCQTNQVVVGICDREAGYACHALSDNSYAGCYTSDDMCDSLGAVSDKKCFVQLDGQEFVVSYTCRETTENGVYVWKMNTDNPTDYEKCDVNCVDATETEEAHCGQLDSRIGQSCTKDEAETGNICGDNDVVLSCYSDGTQRTWHSADNCKGKGETCLTTAAGTSAACYGSATGCTQGEANTHHCSEHEGMGTTLVMSFTYACTEMSDGSFHRISAGSDNCGNAGCNESTGLCNAAQ
jgi:hypothetical protein